VDVVLVEQGKYAFFVPRGDYRVHIERPLGSPWLILEKGSKAICTLMAECMEARAELAATKHRLESALEQLAEFKRDYASIKTEVSNVVKENLQTFQQADATEVAGEALQYGKLYGPRLVQVAWAFVDRMLRTLGVESFSVRYREHLGVTIATRQYEPLPFEATLKDAVDAFMVAYAVREVTPVDPSTLLENPPQPMQPIVLAEDNVIRFKPNKIVQALLDQNRGLDHLDLNDIARMDFSQEDRMQFAQLIGFTVSGFGDEPYADPAMVEQVDRISAALQAKRGTP